MSTHQPETTGARTPLFRIDVPLYTLLQKGSARSSFAGDEEPTGLPGPVFPQQMRTGDLKRSGFVYHANNGVRAFRRWLIPYMQSRVMADEFRPLLSYLFTEWKYNQALLRLSGEDAAPLWLHGGVQHEHNPHQHGRHQGADGNSPRQRHLDRLSHQRDCR
jgi:hypothetical protein